MFAVANRSSAPPGHHGPSINLIVASVRAAVGGSAHDHASGAARTIDDAGIDWAEVIDIATRGKLLMQVVRGLELLDVAPAPALRAAASAYRRATLQINAANLESIGRIAGALGGAGIPYLVFKGPLQQRAIHGDYFIRPSGDVDVLTAESDFDHARAVLGGIGYSMPKECATPWWRHFLGEQHLFGPDDRHATVDLHHRTQQPGCPPPRHPEDYFHHVEHVALGRQRVPTLSLVEATLLSSISLVKAIYHHEPAALYAADISVALRKLDAGEKARLSALGRRQGLMNTLALSLRITERLFGPIPSEIEARRSPSIVDDSLTSIALTPWVDDIRWPKRRSLLWELCDPTPIGGRPGTYLAESARALSSELCRAIYQRRPHDAPMPATA